MKKHIAACGIAMLFASIPAMAQFSSAPAFPGAEGHGRFVTGGRGGKIVHVTNLNDSGTGSLRAAVSGNDKKTVVFDVAGVIALSSNLNIGDNTTIAGQTAPAPGITVRYYTVSPGNNNIIRFMRFRRGQERDVNDGADAMTQRNKTGIIIDHCSLSWSIDEVASFYDNNNFTLQWSTIAESLNNAGHDKGAHGYGGIWGGKLASFHHNMIAHVANRGPRFNGARYMWNGYTNNYDYKTYQWKNFVEAENVDFRNCVMYNAQGTCYGGPGGGQINIVNNYFKAGPVSNSNQERITTVSVASSGNSDSNTDIYGLTSRYYIKGNTTETNTGTKKLNRDWDGVSYDSDALQSGGYYYCKDAKGYYPDNVPSIQYNGARYVRIKSDEEAPAGYVTTHTAANAYNKVLAYVGASLNRDEVDERYVKECKNGTATYTGSVTKKKGLIDVVADVKGYTEANFGTASRPADFDTDGDGMPDEWEKEHGLNPNSATDAQIFNLDSHHYYTNLEVYLNSLVEDIVKAQNEDAETGIEEYYPDYKGDKVTTIYSYVAPTTVDGFSTITFPDGATLTLKKDGKAWSSASSISTGAVTASSIKLSNGAPNTFTAPEGKAVVSVTFYSYVNAEPGTPSYWSQVGSNVFTEEDAKLMESYKNAAKPDVQSFDMGGVFSFDFCNAGKQLAFVMEVEYTDVTGIGNATATKAQATSGAYTLTGQKINGDYKGIIVINGNKYINR